MCGIQAKADFVIWYHEGERERVKKNVKEKEKGIKKSKEKITLRETG